MEVDPIRNREDVEKIKEVAKGRNKILLEIGFNTGLRVSDLLKLKVKDIFDYQHVNLQEQKTKKNRKVSLNPKVKEIVKNYIDDNGLETDDYLYQSRKGDNEPISKVQAYRIMNKLAKKAGLNEKIGTHTLRKSFGYHHYQQYKDMAQLQYIFNHSSVETTKRYIGLTQENVDKSIEGFYL